uniref:Putative secreted protein n=1 Tax=Anopheles marajoara TaxID=58244 RepID=A0A2M4CEI4_9DIPT
MPLTHTIFIRCFMLLFHFHRSPVVGHRHRRPAELVKARGRFMLRPAINMPVKMAHMCGVAKKAVHEGGC